MTENCQHHSRQPRGAFAFALLLGLRVGIASAAVGDANESLAELDCVIEPNVVVDVGSPSAGVVERVLVDRSDRVEAGQVVARLDDGVEQATVELARTKASLTTEEQIRETTLDYERRRKARAGELYKRKVVSEQAVDEARRDARVSDLELRQARENRQLATLESRRAQELLERRTVRSPVSGVVVERFKHGGEFVEDEPIMRIAQLDPLRVEVIVPVEQFGQIMPGMQARVVPELPSAGVYQAVVSVVDKVLDAASGTFGVRLKLPNPDHRLPGGLRCRVSFLEAAPGSPELEDSSSVFTTALEGEASTRAESPTGVDGEPGAHLDGSTAIEPPIVGAGFEGQLSSPLESSPATEGGGDPAPASPAGDAMWIDETARVCRAIGPLESEADIRNVAAALEGVAKNIHRREVIDSIPEGYAVFAAQGALEAGARALMQRLEELGVEDVFLTDPRSEAPEVLLGFYRRQENVERRRSTLEALGIQVEVRPRLRQAARFWLDIELEADFDPLALRRAAESAGISLPSSVEPCS